MPNPRAVMMGLFILLFVGGCTPGGSAATTDSGVDGSPPVAEAPVEAPSDGTEEEPWPSTLYLTTFLDSWNAAVEEVYRQLEKKELPIRPTDDDYKIGWIWLTSHSGQEMKLRKDWAGLWTGERNEELSLWATACKMDGRIIQLSLYGDPETPRTDTKMAFLRPFFEIFIAVINPDLSLEERRDLMHQLLLDSDMQTFDEAFFDPGKPPPSATVGRVYYEVSILGSDLGGTVALEAILDKHCWNK
ncbi:MAG: hypothetical protein KM310_05025 [Clostridiales bacterium]|nr:hypothetical protein [Clostridiales bacterium]